MAPRKTGAGLFYSVQMPTYEKKKRLSARVMDCSKKFRGGELLVRSIFFNWVSLNQFVLLQVAFASIRDNFRIAHDKGIT
jgi:hypothetical protein